MSFRSHAQLEQVKNGYVASIQNCTNLCGIICRRLLTVWPVCRHAMDLLRTQIELAQQGLLSQGIVALRIVWRNAAFIAPEKVDCAPVNLAAVWLARQQAIELAGRRAS